MKKEKYYMTFYRDIALLHSICNKQTLFFAEMASRMDGDQVVQMTQYVREEIADSIGISEANKLTTVRQYLYLLKGHGLIADIGKGAYMINPKLHGHNNFADSINKKHQRFIKIQYNANGSREKIECGDVTDHETGEISPLKTPTKNSQTIKKQKGIDETLTIKEMIAMRPDQVNDELWEAAMNARKKRKAGKTSRSINGFIRSLAECVAAGHSGDKVLEVYLEETWKGLKIEWVENKLSNGKPSNTIKPAVRKPSPFFKSIQNQGNYIDSVCELKQ
jgi:hypothetical protein